jgi:hypothetical protein
VTDDGRLCSGYGPPTPRDVFEAQRDAARHEPTTVLRVMDGWLAGCARRRQLDMYAIARWLAIREVLERNMPVVPVLIDVPPPVTAPRRGRSAPGNVPP